MSGYKKYECPNNLCRATNCFRHCNHCGVEVKWLNYLGDPYTYTTKKGEKKRLPYLLDDTVHRCMQKGTKDGKFYNNKEVSYIVLDEYRTIRRYSGPVFKCDFCGAKGDLPVMRTHHTNEKQYDCADKLMKKFFNEKPQKIIDPNTYTLDDY